jgi:hypothetical protein
MCAGMLSRFETLSFRSDVYNYSLANPVQNVRPAHKVKGGERKGGRTGT